MNKNDITIEEISKSLYIVNRNAKTAGRNSILYKLKHETIIKLLEEGKAKKVGLHYSKNPRNAQQHSDVLVEVGEFYFHIPSTKEDFENLHHLGEWDNEYRNPKIYFPIKKAKYILHTYTGLSFEDNSKEKKAIKQNKNKPIGIGHYSKDQPSYRSKNKYTSYFS